MGEMFVVGGLGNVAKTAVCDNPIPIPIYKTANGTMTLMTTLKLRDNTIEVAADARPSTDMLRPQRMLESKRSITTAGTEGGNNRHTITHIWGTHDQRSV